MLLGGIEAGGTKMVCAVGGENGQIFERVSFPTATPDETIPKMVEFFRDWMPKDKIDTICGDGKISALGIGCFGPIDLNKNSPTYGYIQNSPKLEWQNLDIVSKFENALQVPVGFDTDVNAAMLGEVEFGVAQNCDSAIYITIGTGVGVGVYINGRLLHGMQNPEAGHIQLIRHQSDIYFKGVCPYHENCFESLASGPSIAARWSKPAKDLYDKPEVWELESFYIAQAISNYVLTYSPQKIVLWGGVMHNEALLPMVKKQLHEFLNGYINNDLLEKDDYITIPGLGDNPGIIGAIQLGYLALNANEK